MTVRSQPEPNTLGLDDDLDGIYLVDELERALGISIPSERLETVTTVGQLFALIQEVYPQTGSGKCPTSVAFYRIRTALRRRVQDRRIGPSTLLAGLPIAPRQVRKDLRRAFGFSLPPFDLTPRWNAVLLFALVAAVAFLIGGMASRDLVLVTAGLASIASATTIVALDPGRFPESLATVGDLSGQTVMFNHGRLTKLGCRPARGSELWVAYQHVIASMADGIAVEDIRPGTILLQAEFDRLRKTKGH